MINYDEIIENNSNQSDYFGKKYPNINANLDNNTHKFNDVNFKPSKEIIGISEVEAKIDSGILKWKRISDIIDVENDKSDIYFVSQRFIGDCYLISFLRSLQHFQPEKYYYLFGICFPEIGYYEIYFFTENGDHIKVFVDDYVLVDENNNPYFSSLKDDEEQLYTAGRNVLIEKAFAKMNKSYNNIEGGLNASFYIVGKDSTSEKGFLTKEDKYIYQTFKDNINVKKIVLCGTINEGRNPQPMKGLVEGHMYSLFEAEEKLDLKILKLNNPYGINYPKEMEKFKLGLDTKYKDIENEIIEYNKSNVGNGNLKLDVQNFKRQFDLVEICSFIEVKKSEKQEPIKGKGPNPISPLLIQKSYTERINTLDALGISKKDQKQFIEKCGGNLGKSLYQLFKAFMKFGTTRETFYMLLGRGDYAKNKNQSSISYYLSYLNPLSYLKNK